MSYAYLVCLLVLLGGDGVADGEQAEEVLDLPSLGLPTTALVQVVPEDRVVEVHVRHLQQNREDRNQEGGSGEGGETGRWTVVEGYVYICMFVCVLCMCLCVCRTLVFLDSASMRSSSGEKVMPLIRRYDLLISVTW